MIKLKLTDDKRSNLLKTDRLLLKSHPLNLIFKRTCLAHYK
ncbi:hypothetical protein HD_0694 [[Haemophilus] ducreyi 35000HP]|uniref:Uncharacterized protein n=1 Tax=Haemophilus ducreyi (strain 35000HP / ATCC 700724) TaxID=233412 RepID=Q7VN80_HAEDU|nr:hypothetical protein HD_0694 [[Haemophilus] ducreyi 35000HP]